MKAGPKAAADDGALPYRPRSTGSARCAAFCDTFVRVPKGTGALSPLLLRDWQRDLIGSVEDADPTLSDLADTPRLVESCDGQGQVAELTARSTGSAVSVVSRVGTDHQRMSGAVGIEQVGQLARRALLVGDRVVPRVGRIPE
jgi:hypothetical protein